MGGPLPMMRAAVAALLVAGAAAYSCPAHSYFSGGSWPPASFDSCTFFWGLVKHNGGCINPTAVPGYTNPCNITECPSGSFMNSWPVCNLDDCTCNYGYLENTAGGCDRNTFTCPANSYQYTSGSPTDTTGCRCNYGYQADNGAPPGHLFTSCVAVASTTSGTTTSSTFSCPANSYQFAAGSATGTEHCVCNYGYHPDNGAARGQSFTSCVQDAPTPTPTPTYECPDNSYPSGPWPPPSFTGGCTCNYGYKPNTAGTGCETVVTSGFTGCPAYSWATHYPPRAFTDCQCHWGYEGNNGACVRCSGAVNTATGACAKGLADKAVVDDEAENEFNNAMFIRETTLKKEHERKQNAAIAAFEADVARAKVRKAAFEADVARTKMVKQIAMARGKFHTTKTGQAVSFARKISKWIGF